MLNSGGLYPDTKIASSAWFWTLSLGSEWPTLVEKQPWNQLSATIFYFKLLCFYLWKKKLTFHIDLLWQSGDKKLNSKIIYSGDGDQQVELLKRSPKSGRQARNVVLFPRRGKVLNWGASSLLSPFPNFSFTLFSLFFFSFNIHAPLFFMLTRCFYKTLSTTIQLLITIIKSSPTLLFFIPHFKS